MFNRDILSVQDLVVKSLKENKQILHGINLKIKKGEVHAVIGPNGSGKSTLACSIMGCSGLKITGGKIVFDGKVINKLPMNERANLGLTISFQEPARFDGITVKKYISLGMEEYDEEEVVNALELVNLEPEEYLDRFVDDSLSGGERKRVELASIIAMKPKLAILDEIDSGIDFVSFNKLGEIFKYFKKHKTALLIITHREEMLQFVDKASLLCKGKIVKQGKPDKIGEHFRNVCKKCMEKDPEKVKRC